MKVRYEFTLIAKCPVDGSSDIYDTTVEATEMIRVEDLLSVTFDRPKFQEEITQDVASRFKCKVTTFGLHSGVKTTCEAGPA